MCICAICEELNKLERVLQVSIKGLHGLQYFDNTDGVDDKSESEDAVAITGETDRIYKGAGDTIIVS